MKNSEVIENLINYFMTQEKELVCRLAANFLVDMNRVRHSCELGYEELKCLTDRIENNVNQLQLFIKNGPMGNMTFTKFNSEVEE